ncbi:unnamed protein product [Notodromas monacha]|uniref:Uncharacterized protein n=1 Tax=Notodromas monacha TaxID=399045 RepID=A0A7R9BWH3_9CRUS|nr:unnamed protein product [Notodromas monacha]CAG0922070.1 unnamed protein product [Notodromas monacha]
MLQVVGNILSFLAVYTCLDSVAVDLDSADAVPESLKWTLNEEKELLREYEDLQEGNGRWKLYESHPNEGFDVYWLHSDAYDREMIKLTIRSELSKNATADRQSQRKSVEVVDFIWTSLPPEMIISYLPGLKTGSLTASGPLGFVFLCGVPEQGCFAWVMPCGRNPTKYPPPFGQQRQAGDSQRTPNWGCVDVASCRGLGGVRVQWHRGTRSILDRAEAWKMVAHRRTSRA